MKKLPVSVYLVLLAASLIWVSNQGGPLPYMVFYTVLLFPFLCGAYLIYSIRSLRFHQELPMHRVEKGTLIPLHMVVENTGLLPVVHLQLVVEKELCTLHGFSEDQVIRLQAGARWEHTYDAVCLYAGSYEIGAQYLYLKDCFGWFSWRYRIPSHYRAIVRPQITDRASRIFDMEVMRSEMELPRAASQEPMAGPDLRNYQYGDSLKRIHWKNSARMQKLMVRMPEPRQMQMIRIVLLPGAVGYDTRHVRQRDQFLELIVSIANYFCMQNKTVVFYYPRHGMTSRIIDSKEQFLDFYLNIPEEMDRSDKISDGKSWIYDHFSRQLEGLWVLEEKHEDGENMVLEQVGSSF